MIKITIQIGQPKINQAGLAIYCTTEGIDEEPKYVSDVIARTVAIVIMDKVKGVTTGITRLLQTLGLTQTGTCVEGPESEDIAKSLGFVHDSNLDQVMDDLKKQMGADGDSVEGQFKRKD